MASTYTVSPTELIVSIDDQSMVKKIRQALQLMKGVTSVKVKRHKSTEELILNSSAYKESMKDVEQGHVFEAASVDDMFKQILADV